jgi:hypothetical protein
MVKITPFPLYQTSTLRSPRNVVVSTKNGKLIATKWPRKRGPAKTPGAYYQQQTFGIAANWAADPEPANLAMAIEMAKDTTMIPRDFLTAAAYGKILTITLPDGTQWERYWDVAANAQLTLDQITTTIGALIYRSPAGWVEVPPGPDGYYLSIIDHQPIWLPAPTAPTSEALSPFQGMLYAASSSAILINSTGGPYFLLEQGKQYAGVAVIARNITTAALLSAVVYAGDLNAPTTREIYSPQYQFSAPGLLHLPFPTPWTVPSTGMYAIGITTRGAVWSQCNTTSAIGKWYGSTSYPPPDPMSSYTLSAAPNIPTCWLY